MLILGQRHLRAVLAEYQAHYNTARPQRALGKSPPAGRECPPTMDPDVGSCGGTGSAA